MKCRWPGFTLGYPSFTDNVNFYQNFSLISNCNESKIKDAIILLPIFPLSDEFVLATWQTYSMVQVIWHEFSTLDILHSHKTLLLWYENVFSLSLSFLRNMISAYTGLVIWHQLSTKPLVTVCVTAFVEHAIMVVILGQICHIFETIQI